MWVHIIANELKVIIEIPKLLRSASAIEIAPTYKTRIPVCIPSYVGANLFAARLQRNAILYFKYYIAHHNLRGGRRLA